MSNCCDESQDCCASEPRQARVCPSCGQRGKSVEAVTPRSLVLPGRMEDVQDDVSFYFCATSNCEVVYFADEGPTIPKSEVRVRVGLKETEDPIPVCYCFGFTEGMIADEIARTGSTAIPDRIRKEISAGNCRCETENPQGTCCLGNVHKAVKKVREQVSETTEATE